MEHRSSLTGIQQWGFGMGEMTPDKAVEFFKLKQGTFFKELEMSADIDLISLVKTCNGRQSDTCNNVFWTCLFISVE